MKNILFIAPYRQLDGWGLAAKDYARALETTDNNIAIRPVYMSSSTDWNLDEQLLDMEKRSFDHYDIIIEKVLPHLYEKSEVPTLALFTLETGNLNRSYWFDSISLMDGAMMPSSFERKVVESSDVNTPAYNISEPVDTTVFDKDWEPLKGMPKDTFNFYFIGEFIPRKNLDALIIAFHTEFHRSEPVNLVIKANRFGIDEFQLNQTLSDYINVIKSHLRIYEIPSLYKSELLITTRLSDDEMCELHTGCDCFVMPSHGEAFCRPAVDAMGFGNTPIVTDNTGMTDFITNDLTGWVVESYETPVNTSSAPIPTLYTGRETWYDINILSLRKAMREAYETDKSDDKHLMKETGKRIAKTDFSYKTIGKNIERVIDEY